LLRQGLRRLIEEMGDLDVVAEAGDGLELLNLLKKTAPDMVILDISMPNLGGIEAARVIKMTYPEIKILFLSMHKAQEYLDHAMATGAEGYLVKEDADTELFSAIDSIRHGRNFISPLFSRMP
jgi:DNA-binding NarL/FixJ family response regulator